MAIRLPYRKLGATITLFSIMRYHNVYCYSVHCTDWRERRILSNSKVMIRLSLLMTSSPRSDVAVLV